MDTRTTLNKLIRTAKKNDARANDENLDSVTRATAALKRDNAERAAFGILYDPHAVRNAQIEADRLKQLAGRKSTQRLPEKARLKRESAADAARQEFQSLAAQADKLEPQAREIIEIWMGRKKI